MSSAEPSRSDGSLLCFRQSVVSLHHLELREPFYMLLILMKIWNDMKIDFLKRMVETHGRIEKALKRVQNSQLHKEYRRLLGVLEFIMELMLSPNFSDLELECELGEIIARLENAEKLEKEQKEELKKPQLKRISR